MKTGHGKTSNTTSPALPGFGNIYATPLFTRYLIVLQVCFSHDDQSRRRAAREICRCIATKYDKNTCRMLLLQAKIGVANRRQKILTERFGTHLRGWLSCLRDVDLKCGGVKR
jgi:hypothetical protein